VLAVYNLCQTISAFLMQQHKDQLIEKMMEIDQQLEIDFHHYSESTDKNLTLPFDEPF